MRTRFGRPRMRRRRRRAVHPIIATILLCAIAVILGAVFYVLVGGLVHGPGATPIGTAFAFGTPTAGQCTAAQVSARTCATAGDKTFTFAIIQSTVTLGSVGFVLETGSGGAFTNTVPGSFAIQTDAAAEVASFAEPAGPGFAMTTSWSHYAGMNTGQTRIDTSMSLVLDTGIPVGSWTPGQGNIVFGVGAGSFSGTTAAQVLP